MKLKLLVVLLCISILCPQSLFSQKINYRFSQKKEGLLHSFILCLFQDSRGYLWIGTSGGLHRYDGYSIKTYTRENDSLGLSNAAIRDITEDHDGNIWLATEYGLNEIVWKTDSIVKYFHQANNPNSLSLDHLRTVYQDKDGIFWIGTYNGGLNRFDPKTGIFKHDVHRANDPSSLPSNKINAFLCDRKGNCWIGTELGGLSLFDKKRDCFTNFSNQPLRVDGLNDNTVNCIFEDKKGFLWIGTWYGGLNRLDPSKQSFTNYKQAFFQQYHYDIGPIRAIQQDTDGMLWLATFHNGLVKFNPENAQFTVFNAKDNSLNSISSNDLWSLLIDKSNMLWIGTFGNYLNALDLNQSRILSIVKDSNTTNTLSDNTIFSMLEDSKGLLWISTKLGIDCYDPKTTLYKHYFSQTTDKKYFSCIFEDREGRLWIGKDGEMIRLEKDRKTYMVYKGAANQTPKLGDHLVRDIEQDKYGNIWISEYDNGVYLLTLDEINKKDPEKAVFKNYRAIRGNNNSLKVDLVWDIFKDREGELWFATSTVLSRYDDKTDKFIHYNQFISPSCFFQDEDGILWIGSYGSGMYRYDKKTGKIDHFISNDYPFKIVYCIVSDQKKHLWISSSTGLHRFDPKDKSVISFDENDGLLSNESNPFAFKRLKSGNLVYGTKSGYNIINPENLQQNHYLPTVVLTDFLLFNKSVTIDSRQSAKPFLHQRLSELKEIVLDADQKVFSIEFAALYFSDPENNRYAYKLEGFDKDWIYTNSTKRMATYTNLSQGKYTFMVKASNSDGLWNPKSTTIQIKILPPWWRTWWAMLLYFLMIIFLLFVFRKMVLYKERMNNILKLKDIEYRKQKEIEEMKMNFFTNISHEFRTPLTLILGPAEQLVKDAKYAEIRNYLSIIHRNAKNMLLLVNQLLDFRKMESGKLKLSVNQIEFVPFLEQIVSDFAEFARQKEIDLQFRSEFQSLDAWIDTDIVYKILFNLISNALKFTEKGRVSIELCKSASDDKQGDFPTVVLLVVKDDGIGIAMDQQANIFNRFYQVNQPVKHHGSGVGLALTKELALLHKGAISVESTLGKGSEFVLELPIAKACYSLAETSPFNTRAKDQNTIKLEDIFSEIEQQKVEKIKDAKAKTILLIDDNDDMLSFLSMQLKETFHLLFASDGEEGIAKAQQHFPDLIISDIMMPKMDGIELCRLIKTTEDTSHIPVILLTARDSEKSRIEGYQTGADSYITKPFNSEILLAQVNNLLNNRERLLELFMKEQSLPPKVMANTQIDEVFISKLTKVIEDHLDDPDLNAEFIGREVGVSRTLLYNKLSSLTGQSVNEFIKSIRLRRSAVLLREGHRVTDVAYMVGFRSQSYFTRSFVKQYLVSPSAYSGGKGE